VFTSDSTIELPCVLSIFIPTMNDAPAGAVQLDESCFKSEANGICSDDHGLCAKLAGVERDNEPE